MRHQERPQAALTPRRRPSRASRVIAMALAGVSLVSACAPQASSPVVSADAVQAYVANYPPDLQRLYRQVPLQGQRNLALNQMRSGLAALDLGRLDDAASSFDQALQVIEAIYADNPDAARARSVWYAEAAKDFKGEPYERAMAYYYRGIVYLMQGDYQNARASFRGGLLQDSFMEGNVRMAADFGALAFLEGWAGRCAGFDRGTVEASFAEARNRNGALVEPPPDATVLALFETGMGPIKLTAGSRNEVLRYAPGYPPAISEVEFAYGNRGARGVQAEDIYFQAATRAGRWVDSVNEGKVAYQDTTAAAGGAAVAVGAGLVGASTYQRNNNASAAMAGAGAAILLIGLIAKAAAEAMKTEADARAWDNLPGNIMLTTFSLPPQQVAARGKPAEALPQTIDAQLERAGNLVRRDMQVRTQGGCSIAWGRELPATAISDTAPRTMAAVR